jgi:ketosteroid isomerase-like protein
MLCHLAMSPRSTATIPDQGLADALDRLAEAIAAIGAGDPEPYKAWWADSDDVTLFGAWGPIEKGTPALIATFDWVGRRFTSGRLDSAYEVVETSGDLAYTVGFERGEVSIDGGAPTPMTIRVTHILKRIDGDWRLVHRHADFPPRDQREE